MKMKETRLRGFLLAAALLAALFTGCLRQMDEAFAASGKATEQTQAKPESSAKATRTVVDLAGRKVTIPANVTKVASLTGPSFETVIMLGAVDQVVMTGFRNASSGWAAEVCPPYAKIPVAKKATAPNIEELVELGVDVVLFWDAYPEVIESLNKVGIPVIVTQVNDDGIDTHEQFVELKKKEIMLVGEVFGGAAVEKAKKWCRYVDKTVKYVIGRTGKLDPASRPSVYYVRGPEALSTHGGESYTRYLVDIAGGDLVNKKDRKLHYSTTMERVMEWDPAYIFMGRVNNVELITKDPAWAPIRAVKDGRVYVNLRGIGPTDYCTDCFLLMEQIAKTLHPKLFEDLDMVKAVKSYFADFYGYKLTDKQAEYVLTFKGPDGR